MKNKTRWTLWLSLMLILSLALVACTSSGTEQPADDPAPADDSSTTDSGSDDQMSDEVVQIRYALWDSNQLPPYEQCVADFEAANPNIDVSVEQQGWGDYWDGIQTGMVAGGAPDVFTNHLAKYPEFASKNQLVDIQPFVERDGVDMSQYLEGLADLWARDGARYGLPKDWDTIAVVYNKGMLDAAGVTVEELNNATWNPQDGGSFENILARLTIDANGNNALSADFDKDNVEQYGYIPLSGTDSGGAYGQTQWSHFAASNGWIFNDGLYDTKYYYEDPKLVETIEWMASTMLDKGYAPPFADIASLGGNAIFTSGGAAITHDGSWMIGTYTGNSDFEVGFARLPIGPEGRRSMFNGLADSIWSGTNHVEESWQLVKYLASPACADIVGDAGVVFPAQESGVERALAAYSANGIDVEAFTAQALEEDGTFLFPVTDNASEIAEIMSEAMDAIFLGEAVPAEILPTVDTEVDDTFK